MTINLPTSTRTEKIKENSLDFDTTKNVVLKRLIDEIRNKPTSEVEISTAYNRTYHRHNR